MPDLNRISATLTDAAVTNIQDAIAVIRTNLPFLISLSDSDRQEMAKMGDKSIAFHDKVQGYMVTNLDFNPGYISAGEVSKDQALRLQLLKFVPDLKNLARSADDTVMQVSSELWQADLAYYNNVRQGAHQGAANAQAIYDDLKPRFPGRGGSAGSNPPVNP